jgi:integrase
VQAVRAGPPDRYAATVDAGSGIGLPQGEVFGLSPDDIDWLRRIVHVRRQAKYVGSRLVLAPPKGGKERDVPLSDTVSLRRAAHIQRWPVQAITLPWRVPDGKPATVV